MNIYEHLLSLEISMKSDRSYGVDDAQWESMAGSDFQSERETMTSLCLSCW